MLTPRIRGQHATRLSLLTHAPSPSLPLSLTHTHTHTHTHSLTLWPVSWLLDLGCGFTGSSVFQEDEGVAMDSFNWTSNNKHTDSQTNTNTRFASWVTFDDDEEPVFQPPNRPTQMNLDNLNRSALQDSNSNLIVSLDQNQRRDERHLLDLTPDGTNPAFVLDSPLIHSPTSYSKKNPFFDKEFSNIQPSSINPFSSFFDQQEVKHSQSNGSFLDSPASLSYSSPFFQSTDSDLQGEFVLLSSAVAESGSKDEGLGQDSSRDGLDTLRNLQIADPDECGSPTLPDDLADVTEDEEETAYMPGHMLAQDGWPMLLRIPEKKNIMSSRHWGPIFVRLSDSGTLKFFYEKGLEKPFKVFQLTANHELSEHKLQNYEENGRVHTLSIDHVVYKEKRKIQPKVSVVHLPFREQLVKLGTKNYEDFLSFRHALQERLVGLTTDAGPPSTPVSYSDEEVAVEVQDEFYGVVAKGDCRILEHLVLTRVNMLVFVSGSPACRLGLNDVLVKGKEVVSRHDIIPNTTTRWIRVRECQLHQSVDQQDFTQSRAIAFNPPIGRRFELLRFRTAFAEKTLPFTVRTVASVRGAEVELQSWLVMSTGFSSNRDPLTLIPCENVMIRYPIPELWAKNFRRESVTGEKSLKARFNKGASFGSTSTSGSEPAMRVTLGTAKYEQAFSSVVWRISRLPDKNSALGHPHTFFCHLELGSDWEVPQHFHCQIEVEFDMPATCASKATVRSLSIEDKPDIKKWITYRSHFSYKVAIEQKGSPEGDQPGKCAHQ
ncbi:stonin-2 isoform X2 [Alosa sapidissima]|uniref:stonin-2 isoform X2 n=1 Tax=Alosa sapidissima TaxID=34773 RepID=UPI001C0A28C4|nr:stonin-2 isoform X2 [Alosa sapidissima]